MFENDWQWLEDEDLGLYKEDLMDFEPAKMTPTEFLTQVNETFEYTYRDILIEGEVASFKINQGKWVFFDVKDEESSVGCFMSAWNLRMPLEDGMKVMVEGTPKVTKWGKFSITVETVRPVGEGSLKKAYELLKKKLTAEGLFKAEKKRQIPKGLSRIGVISSTAAAGYADFIKIINARWGGMKVEVAHTQVQGTAAPDQIIKALRYFNERGGVEAIAILRGGGSADDLACFNDEKLVREIAASKIPIITGIGHEVDETLADLAADVRASTPSNVAEMLTYDRKEEKAKIERLMRQTQQTILQKIERARIENQDKMERALRGVVVKYIEPMQRENRQKMTQILQKMRGEIAYYEEGLNQKMRQMSQKLQGEMTNYENILKQKIKLLETLNPERVLAQGYAILNGKISPGNVVKITTYKQEIKATIKEIYERE